MLRISPDEAKNILTNAPSGVKIELRLRTRDKIEVFAVTEMTKADILNEKYTSLIGQPITASDAAEKYDIHRRTIFKWLDKGYITVLASDPIKLLDEAEVKYCVDTYRQRQEAGLGRTGVPLFDDNGLPYELKHKELALKRKKKRN